MNIVAIVVTYNRKKLLKECLESLLDQTIKLDRIIVIDNNSSDNTFEYLEENGMLKNKAIYYKKLNENIGGAGGFYEGIKLSQQFNPEWIWIMDDDTIPRSDCLEKLIDAKSIIKEKISYLASSIYGMNNEFMNVPNINTDKSESGYPNWYKYLSSGIVRIKEATFVSLLINNNAVKEIGYPVRDYFIWGDDTEYTLRLTKYYGNAYLVGDSIAIHKREVSKQLSLYEETNINRINFYYYMIRNTLINKNEYYGKKEVIRYLLRNIKNSFKVLFNKNCKFRFKKFIIINKAISAYILKKYDKRAFKDRLNINVEYEK